MSQGILMKPLMFGLCSVVAVGSLAAQKEWLGAIAWAYAGTHMAGCSA